MMRQWGKEKGGRGGRREGRIKERTGNRMVPSEEGEADQAKYGTMYGAQAILAYLRETILLGLLLLADLLFYKFTVYLPLKQKLCMY